MLVDLSELEALCDMPSIQRVKRYEVAVGSMPPPPARESLDCESCLHTRVIILEEPCLLLPTSYLLSAALTTMSWRNAIAEVG